MVIMEEAKQKSINALKLYIKTVKTIPSEHEWNKYANQEKLLSSKSLAYLYQIKFNKLCRSIRKRRK